MLSTIRSQSPELTIATVTFNSLAYTQLFVTFLQAHADIPYHLIIVDNHSTDGTPAFLRTLKKVEVIYNQRNLGFGPANNQAFKRARTPYFLGLNNDTAIFPGFLRQLLARAKALPEYGEWGVHSNCIGAIDPRTGQNLLTAFPKPAAPTLTQLEQQLHNYYQDFGAFFKQFAQSTATLQTMQTPPDFIGGWSYLVQTEVVRQVGGLFDPRFKIGFWEDVDLSWRLAAAGYKIGLFQNIYLHHYVHASFDNGQQKLKDSVISRRNSLLFAEKWSDQWRSWLADQLQHQSLEQLVQRFFLLGVYFGRERTDWAELQIKLQKEFITQPQVSFSQFLTRHPRIRKVPATT